MVEEKGVIICSFPATGKTTVVQKANLMNIKVCDSDSEDYHWVDRRAPMGERVERVDWVKTYVQHLQEATNKYDFVFASTHDVVRNELVATKTNFVVAYPTRDQKEEFFRRVRERSTGLHGASGVILLDRMWDVWLDQLEGQENCQRIVLQKGEYLLDAISFGKIRRN